MQSRRLRDLEPIPGFGDKYEATIDGTVRNRRTGRVLAGYVGADGYVKLTLTGVGGRHDQTTVRRARAIAIAYYGLPDEGQCVDHLNGNKIDDRPENLEWVTPQENTRRAWAAGQCKAYDRSLSPPRHRNEKTGRFESAA